MLLLLMELFGTSSFSGRAHSGERILTCFEYCEEFLVILILGIRHRRFLDLFVVQVLVVDVHQILHVVFVE